MCVFTHAHIHVYGTFDARFLEFALGSFSALSKISDSKIFETLPLQQFSSNFNQTSYKVSYSGAYIGHYFFGDLPKIKNSMAI